MLRKLRQHDITIVVSTPYMDEAIRCDRVALIQAGQIMTIDKPQNIRDGFSRRLFSAKAADKYRLLIALRQYPGTLSVYPFGDSIHVTFQEEKPDKALSEFLEKNGITDAVINETEAGIEDRFLELMGKEETRKL
jgi:ABC-type multidrug transport system ATPase subunit